MTLFLHGWNTRPIGYEGQRGKWDPLGTWRCSSSSKRIYSHSYGLISGLLLAIDMVIPMNNPNRTPKSQSMGQNCQQKSSFHRKEPQDFGSVEATLWRGVLQVAWLVVSTPLKNMLVSWDDDIPIYEMENNPNVWNHQAVYNHHIPIVVGLYPIFNHY